jgi:hypothetical protein
MDFSFHLFLLYMYIIYVQMYLLEHKCMHCTAGYSLFMAQRKSIAIQIFDTNGIITGKSITLWVPNNRMYLLTNSIPFLRWRYIL